MRQLNVREVKDVGGGVVWFAPIAAWTVGGGLVGVGERLLLQVLQQAFTVPHCLLGLGAAGSYTMGAFGAASWYRR